MQRERERERERESRGEEKDTGVPARVIYVYTLVHARDYSIDRFRCGFLPVRVDIAQPVDDTFIQRGATRVVRFTGVEFYLLPALFVNV